MPSDHRPLRLLGFFLILIAICFGVAYLSVRLMTSPEWAHDEPGGHAWLHQELGLTDEEAARVDAFEAPYRAERRQLQARLEARTADLARLLERQDSFTPEVTEAVHELHRVHGQLQQLSIEHYFDMLSVLPSEKQDKLRALAVVALSTPQ